MAAKPDPSTPESQRPVPTLLRFLGLHMAVGLAVGTAFASLMVMTNIAGLHDLLAGDGQPYLALFMLYVMCALTFGSLAMGVAVMLLPWRSPDGKVHRRPEDEVHKDPSHR